MVTELLGHSFGHAHSGNSSGLRNADHARRWGADGAVSCLEQKLRHLGCLPRPCRTRDHHNVVVMDGLHDPLLLSDDWQGQTSGLNFWRSIDCDTVGFSVDICGSWLM